MNSPKRITLLAAFLFLLFQSPTPAQVYETWVSHYDGPVSNDYDAGRALAVDDSGYIYVTGESWNGFDYDYATVKYNPNGNEVWSRRYSRNSVTDDYSRLIAVDDSGNVFVSGYSFDFPALEIVMLTVKYSPTGNLLWAKTYVSPLTSDDYPGAEVRGLVVDHAGNAYITGSTYDSTGFGYLYTATTIKYAPNGDTLWLRTYKNPSNGFDIPYAMALDDSGNVYVAGYSYFLPGPGNGVYMETIKYDSDGDTIWVKRFTDPGVFSYATAVDLDGAGNVYVSGNYGSDFATIKYSPDGDSLWVRELPGGVTSLPTDLHSSLKVTDAGDVYMTCPATRSYLDTVFAAQSAFAGGVSSPTEGNPNELVFLATSKVNFIVTDPGGDSIGVSFNTIGAGSSYNPANDSISIPAPLLGDYFVRVVLDTTDNSGDTTYDAVARVDGYSQTDLAQNRAVPSGGSEGHSYELIYRESRDYLSAKYNSNGDTIWIRNYDGPTYDTDVSQALTLDDSGNVYITGYSTGFMSFDDYATIKYSSDGDSVWVRRYNGVSDTSDKATAVAVDNFGNVYVTGISNSGGDYYNFDFATIKYSACSILPGDANASGSHTLADIIATVNYLFDKSGFPACGSSNELCWLSDLLCRGDWNGSGTVTLADAIQGVNKLFAKPGGPWDALPSGLCCLPAP